MAARTLTYTINMSVTKALHTGENVIPFDFNSGATKLGTLSDMVLLGRVPNGALVTSAAVRMGANASAAAHAALILMAVDASGTFSTIATLIGSMTGSTAAQLFSSPVPVKVSLADDRAVQYAVLALNFTTGGSETVSFSFQGNIKYLADGSNV